MSDLMTCEAIPSAISSPDLADGRDHSGSQAGRMIDLFGPVPVLANLSPSQAKDLGLMTRDTSGLRGTGSSKSDALQSSLENKLRQRLTGSVSCDITWKHWNTPWGQCLSKPRAQVRSISGTVISLWPTAVANDDNKSPAAHLAMKLRMGERDGTGARRTAITSLQVMVKYVALWSTIRASDGAKGGPNMTFGAGGCPLPSQVSTVANTSNAPMESGGGSLHPEFAGWEMGYPPEWLSCAPSETPSIRGRRRRS